MLSFLLRKHAWKIAKFKLQAKFVHKNVYTIPCFVFTACASVWHLFLFPAEGFQYPTLNLTRWKDVSQTALDHCPTPGAVGAANAQVRFCPAVIN